MEEVGEEEGVWIRLCMMLLQSSVKNRSYMYVSNKTKATTFIRLSIMLALVLK